MQRYIPVDDYRQALERARRRARIDEAQTNESEVEALTQAAGALEAPDAVDPASRALAERQLKQLLERVNDLDSGDLRFRDEADALWSDVQDYAFRSGAETLPQRPQVVVRFSGGPGEPTLRDLAVHQDRLPGSGARRARLPGSASLANFTLHDLLDRPPARSAFHRQRQTQNLLMASAVLGANAARAGSPSAPPVNTGPSKGGASSVGAGPGGANQGERYTPFTPAPADPIDARQEEELEAEEREAEIEATEARVEEAEAEEAQAAADEPIADLIARALPDADPEQREALVADFETAGIGSRNQVAAVAADRGLAREGGDALRMGVGAGLGLDREETLLRLPSRSAFQAIVRTARLDAATA